MRLEIRQDPRPQRDNPNRRMSVRDVSALVEKVTGKSVTDATVYRWTRLRKNKLPSYKAMGSVFFIEDEVSRWLINHTSKRSAL